VAANGSAIGFTYAYGQGTVLMLSWGDRPPRTSP